VLLVVVVVVVLLLLLGLLQDQKGTSAHLGCEPGHGHGRGLHAQGSVRQHAWRVPAAVRSGTCQCTLCDGLLGCQRADSLDASAARTCCGVSKTHKEAAQPMSA
jgi:hypothetical protein